MHRSMKGTLDKFLKVAAKFFNPLRTSYAEANSFTK